MSDDDLVTRTDGPLVFHVRPGSYAEERLGGLSAAFVAAAARIAEHFGKHSSDLNPIHLCFVDVPHSHEESSDPAGTVYCLQINSESPGQPAEIVLTPIVADQLVGPGHPFGRFWIDGLAGYLAAQAGSTEYAEMPARVNRMREEGQLQSVLEYIRQRAERRSPLASYVASAFVTYLITWRGPERFQRLLLEARKGNPDAFRSAYRPPLQVVEGQWLRKLEAANQTGGGSMIDAVRRVDPVLHPLCQYAELGHAHNRSRALVRSFRAICISLLDRSDFDPATIAVPNTRYWQRRRADCRRRTNANALCASWRNGVHVHHQHDCPDPSDVPRGNGQSEREPRATPPFLRAHAALAGDVPRTHRGH